MEQKTFKDLASQIIDLTISNRMAHMGMGYQPIRQELINIYIGNKMPIPKLSECFTEFENAKDL